MLVMKFKSEKLCKSCGRTLYERLDSRNDRIIECIGCNLPESSCLCKPLVTSSIENILEERGSRYGSFVDNSNIAQNLKKLVRIYPQHAKLRDCQIEALDQIFAKISRIIVGDPDYVDNWDDIAGYATLVAKILRGNE